MSDHENAVKIAEQIKQEIAARNLSKSIKDDEITSLILLLKENNKEQLNLTSLANQKNAKETQQFITLLLTILCLSKYAEIFPVDSIELQHRFEELGLIKPNLRDYIFNDRFNKAIKPAQIPIIDKQDLVIEVVNEYEDKTQVVLDKNWDNKDWEKSFWNREIMKIGHKDAKIPAELKGKPQLVKKVLSKAFENSKNKKYLTISENKIVALFEFKNKICIAYSHGTIVSILQIAEYKKILTDINHENKQKTIVAKEPASNISSHLEMIKKELFDIINYKQKDRWYKRFLRRKRTRANQLDRLKKLAGSSSFFDILIGIQAIIAEIKQENNQFESMLLVRLQLLIKKLTENFLTYINTDDAVKIWQGLQSDPIDKQLSGAISENKSNIEIAIRSYKNSSYNNPINDYLVAALVKTLNFSLQPDEERFLKIRSFPNKIIADNKTAAQMLAEILTMKKSKEEGDKLLDIILSSLDMISNDLQPMFFLELLTHAMTIVENHDLYIQRFDCLDSLLSKIPAEYHIDIYIALINQQELFIQDIKKNIEKREKLEEKYQMVAFLISQNVKQPKLLEIINDYYHNLCWAWIVQNINFKQSAIAQWPVNLLEYQDEQQFNVNLSIFKNVIIHCNPDNEQLRILFKILTKLNKMALSNKFKVEIKDIILVLEEKYKINSIINSVESNKITVDESKYDQEYLAEKTQVLRLKYEALLKAVNNDKEFTLQQFINKLTNNPKAFTFYEAVSQLTAGLSADEISSLLKQLKQTEQKLEDNNINFVVVIELLCQYITGNIEPNYQQLSEYYENGLSNNSVLVIGNDNDIKKFIINKIAAVANHLDDGIDFINQIENYKNIFKNTVFETKVCDLIDCALEAEINKYFYYGTAIHIENIINKLGFLWHKDMFKMIEDNKIHFFSATDYFNNLAIYYGDKQRLDLKNIQHYLNKFVKLLKTVDLKDLQHFYSKNHKINLNLAFIKFYKVFRESYKDQNFIIAKHSELLKCITDILDYYCNVFNEERENTIIEDIIVFIKYLKMEIANITEESPTIMKDNSNDQTQITASSKENIAYDKTEKEYSEVSVMAKHGLF